MADVSFGWIRVPPEESNARHHHPRRAVAALQSVFLPETFLNRMKFAVLFEPFDSTDFATVRLHGEDGAGLHGLAIDQDRARAAVRRVATNVRAGEPKLVAQKVHQQKA